MIPEWEEEFDLKAANELKESILAKDMKSWEQPQRLSEKPAPIAIQKTTPAFGHATTGLQLTP